ncbi:Ubiquinol-cytochrome c chaperone [Methylocella tundrae]|jgi:cytochrome b pre-mRNA-processing protein 3|uniref:Ubiquinol-cytochrome c chaperone n=2 Tax=Methylocella tundrae TaxID=227605 RepID=A0A8B6MB07_METTU|nr:ubiquinol-cytochrome C chaperone family protein [Methylocella tundrae]WPP05760.1 ubiquinol-cytochrome C chaperone family protein [Methylocella tundrae]VTZ51459.1 Ubiquinol-cytochrome c chaperone [Methylocella tundrae]
MLSSLFRRSANRPVLDRLHGEIIAAAREPALYADYGVPDTFEGRFEAMTLHATLVLRRLNVMAAPAPDLAQDLADAIFAHLDATLREMGVGDAAVPKRMKTLAEAFLGRGVAYDQALRADASALLAALARNVYADRADAARLARYVKAASAALEEAPFEAFAKGPVPFPKPAAII